MASYRLSMKLGKIGYAKPHAEYVLREGKYSKGHKKEDLQYKESGNMPEWAVDNPRNFWEAADYFEPINGRTYREFELSLPNELTLEENITLMNEFKNEMLGEDFAYTYAIHTSYNNVQMNTHAHFMFTERKNDGIERDMDTFFKRSNFRYPERGGAKKDRNWQKKGVLLNARKLFADLTNKHLEKAGLDERVDHRSNEAQMNEALEKCDIDKVEYLTRYPVSIPGRLLSKAENRLTKWEKKQISEYHVNRQIKRDKEAAYKAKLNKKDPLEKEDLILEVKKIDKKLDENQLKKSTLNSITNGNYYKHLNQMWKLRGEIKENPTNLKLKKELEEIRVKVQEIEEYLPGTSRYIAKYNVLSKAYSKKRESYLQELNDRFSVQEKALPEYHTEKNIEEVKENIKVSKVRFTIDLSNHFAIKDNLQYIHEKLDYLNTKLEDKEQLRSEAMDRVSGYKFSSFKSLYYSMKQDSSRDQQFDNLQKQCAKLYKDLEEPTIKSLITKDSSKMINSIKKEVQQLTFEKDILKKALSKTETPGKGSSNRHNITRLINLRGEYESSKLTIERLKERIAAIPTDDKVKPEEVEKKTIQYARMVNKETEKAVILEKLIEKQEALIKDIPKLEVIRFTKGYKEKGTSKHEILEKGIDKLDMILKSPDQVKKLAINNLTKGKFNNLQVRKTPFEEQLDLLNERRIILENKIRLASGIRVFEKTKYRKDLKTLNEKITLTQERYSSLKKEEETLINSLDPALIASKTKELNQILSKALYKSKSDLAASKSKNFVCSDLARSMYKKLSKRYSQSNSKYNSSNLKEINNLLKDNVNLAQARLNIKNKIFKREREEDVAELER